MFVFRSALSARLLGFKQTSTRLGVSRVSTYSPNRPNKFYFDDKVYNLTRSL